MALLQIDVLETFEGLELTNPETWKTPNRSPCFIQVSIVMGDPQ